MDQLPPYKKQAGDIPTVIHNNKGVDKCNSGNYQEAIAEFDEALRLDPKNLDAEYNKAIALISWGRHIVLNGNTMINSGIDILSEIADRENEVFAELINLTKSLFQ